jgi:predicted dehydrogenase
MKPLNILVVGSGMYVCGRGTEGYGTVMPAICEWKKRNVVGSVYMAGTSPESIRIAKRKISGLCDMTGVDLSVKYFPENGKRNSGSYKDALRLIPKPSCAIVAVPDDFHREVAGYAIEKGLHTLVVKPLAPTVREVKELIDLQSQKGVHCAVEFHKRLDYANMKLKDAIRSGVIGEPLYFLAEFSQRKSMPTKIFKKWVATTNIFQYLGVHYADIVYYATGAKPIRAMAVGQKIWLVKQGIETYDSIEAVIEWELSSGIKFTSTIITNWIDPESTSAMSDQKIKVVGTMGRIESDQKKRGIVIVTDEKGVDEPNPYFCAQYAQDGKVAYMGYGIDTITQFLDDVSGIVKGVVKVSDLVNNRPTFKEALVSTMVLAMVNKSLESGGEWINIRDMKNA